MQSPGPAGSSGNSGRRPGRGGLTLRLPVRAGVFLLFLFAAASSAFAQRGAIRGTIVDPDGEPLAGVRIQIVLLDGGGRPIRLETNEKGEFLRAGVRVENYRVAFELDGYQPLQAMVSVTNGGQAYIDEVLQPLPEGVLSQADSMRAEQHLAAAQEAFEVEDFPAAAAEFRGFIELQPRSGPAHFNLAATLEQMDDYPAAIEAYETAHELGPGMAEGLLAVADLHGRMQQWEEAIAAFDRVMELVEGNALHLFNYAVYASNAGREDLADQFYERATVADPDFAPAFVQLGMVKARQEDREGAIAAFERYLELDPDGAQAVVAHEMLDSLREPGC